MRGQYSGNAHGIIKNIELVNCVYVNPETEQFWLLNYCLFVPEAGGKTKLDHVGYMLAQLAARHIPYRTMLMASWYATTALFKQLTEVGKYLCCPLKTRFKRLGATGSLRIRLSKNPVNWSPRSISQHPP